VAPLEGIADGAGRADCGRATRDRAAIAGL
jgi:hypothetical protein